MVSRAAASDAPESGALEEFRAPIDALPDPDFALAPERDADGNVVDLVYRFVNEAGRRLYGKTRDEIVGHRQLELFLSVRNTEIWPKYLEVSGEVGIDDVPDRVGTELFT